MFENNLKSPFVALSFPENRYEAIEESRRLLNLTESEFRSLLRVLSRTDFGTLNFSFGTLTISLSGCGEEEVCLTIGLEQRRVEKFVGYTFRLSELGLSMKQRKLHDFEDE